MAEKRKAKKEIKKKEAKKIFTTDILDKITGAAKTEKGKTYTILGLTFITFAILAAFAIRPTVKAITELRKKIDEFKATAQAFDEKQAALKNLKDQYTSTSSEGGYQEALQFLDTDVVTDSADLPFLYANINKKAEAQSVSVTSIEADRATPGENNFIPDTHLIELSVRAEGSKDKILDWTSELEEFPRPLLIDSLVMSESSTEEDEFSVNLRIYTYYYNPEADE